jgi:hypothetical protein
MRDGTGPIAVKDNTAIAQIRREISRKVDFDPKRLIEFCRKRQKARAAKGPARPER